MGTELRTAWRYQIVKMGIGEVVKVLPLLPILHIDPVL